MSDRPPSKQRAVRDLEVHCLVPWARVRKEYLLCCAESTARRARVRLGQVNFVVIGDREMSRLHRTYSKIRGTTDVLTFDLSDRSGRSVDGDVYICLDQARRQAREYRVPLYQEVARLAVHGVLHLAGYDDATDAERRQMKELEDRALRDGVKS